MAFRFISLKRGVAQILQYYNYHVIIYPRPFPTERGEEVTTVAVLSPSVRLVVFQFHVKNKSIPEGIPKYSDFHKPTACQFEGTGVRIMEPTKDVLSDFVASSAYRLIDAWYNTEEDDWSRSVIRFVFCHQEHLNPEGLRPEFVAQRDGLLESFNNLAGKNLWRTMIHSNSFFVAGKATSESVLVLDCDSRESTVKLVQINKDDLKAQPILEEIPATVFQGGREKVEQGIGPGIGPKVLLTDKANRLKLVGNQIILVAPEPRSTASEMVAMIMGK